MTTKLTGAFITIHKVVDPDGVPVETLVATTQGDVSLPFNPRTAETTPHNEDRSTRKGLGDAPSLQFGGLLVSDAAALTTLGFLSATLVKGYGAALDSIRIKIYENKGGAVSQQFLLYTVVPLLQDFSWPSENFATWRGEFHINGNVKKEV